ncbi:MAG: hypothetical protein Kow0037_13730 [Calditrichia bacterium]
MKLRLVKLVLVSMLLILLISCAGGQKVKKEHPQLPQTPQKVVDESFDPLTLPPDDLDITAVKPEREERRERAVTRIADTVKVENKLVDGFRVQLLSMKDLTNATRAKEIAQESLSDLQLHFYLEFDAPYYKVRMGDFKTKAEAEPYKNEARRRGYSKAWIVRSKVWSHPDLLSPDSTRQEMLNSEEQ